MRRTDQEFKEEILRREAQYQAHRKRRREKAINGLLCIALVLAVGTTILPFWGGMGGSSDSAAPAEENYAISGSSEEMESAVCEAGEGYNADVWDVCPCVMVDSELFFDTGYVSGDWEKDGSTDGEITSSVDQNMIPMENDQSNFGTGYAYRIGEREGTVEIFMNDKWRIFATEAVKADGAYK